MPAATRLMRVCLSAFCPRAKLGVIERSHHPAIGVDVVQTDVADVAALALDARLKGAPGPLVRIIPFALRTRGIQQGAGES